MMELLAGVGIAVVLVGLLIFAVSRSTDEPELAWPERESTDRSKAAAFSPELVRRLFSQEDWEFVKRLGSAALLKSYRKERQAVAMVWVRRISMDLSRAKEAHTLAARTSANLKAGEELQLFFWYVSLKIACGLLVLFIQFLDLYVISNLAANASRLAVSFLERQRTSSMPNRDATRTSAGAA